MKEISISISLSLRINDETDNVNFERSMKVLMELAKCGEVNITEEEKPQLLLSDYMRSCFQATELRSSTIRNRMSTIIWVERLYPDLQLKDIPTGFVQDFMASLKENGLSVNTLVKHAAHLRVCLLKAARNRLIPSYWLDSALYCQKRGPFRHSFLSKKELEQLENLDMDSIHSISRMIIHAFLFCCYTGLRYSDVSQLRYKHLEWSDDVYWLSLCMKKTGSPIRIPLSKLFGGKGLLILKQRRHQPYDQESRLFPINSNEYANKVLKKVFSRLDVHKHVTFHTSRHTFATLCLGAGVKLEVIQTLLGHHSIKTTQTYATMTNQALLDSLKNIAW